MIHVRGTNVEQQAHLAEYSFECSPIPGFWIARNGDIFRVNKAACQGLSYTKEELESLTVFDIDPSASPETWPHHWAKLKQQKTIVFQSHHLTSRGELFEVEITVNFLKVGSQEFNFAFARSIEQQKAVEEDLIRTKKRQTLIVQTANDGIWDWNPKEQKIECSDRWFTTLGYIPPQIKQNLDIWLQGIHPDDRGLVKATFNDFYHQHTGQLEIEFRACHAQGYYRWILCRGMALFDSHGKADRVAGSFTDISERREAQDRLIHEALHDSLTGLPNRNLLLNHLEEIILETQTKPKFGFAVLFLDLDRFKLVNDSLGHQAGDQLLIEVAQRLIHSVDSNHMISCLGGDEFIIVLERITQPEEVIQTTQRILKNLSTPVFLGSQTIYPKVSIGISLSHPEQLYPKWLKESHSLLGEDYLQRADIAMCRAKQSNHSRYAIFTKDMQTKVIRRLQLEVDMQEALEKGEFRLVYQPIVNLQKGDLLGFEALLRWHHPIRGLIGPDHFILIAEETGLIITIGEWVLEQACQQMAKWQSMPSCSPQLFVSVNLASPHIMQPNFVDKVQHILLKTQVQPNNLKLEITESAIIENKNHARQQILALKDRNIKICMDDFGTGYSSLGYLHQLPIDCLKIDRSFVQQIHSIHDNPEIIRAILAIAQSLRMNVIAEGVETLQQAKLLKEIGCPCGQGYLFNKPLSVLNATRQIKAKHPKKASLALGSTANKKSLAS